MYFSEHVATGRVVETAIIGAGIIGLATALRLQLDGYKVLVLDSGDPGAGCSSGNAGYLSEGNFFPLASPEMLWAVPRMLADPMGALTIRPAYLPKLIPWGLRVVAAARREARARSVGALAALTRDAIKSFEPLLVAANAQNLLDVRGGLHLFTSASALQTRAAMLPLYAERGFEAARLTAAQVRDLEPAITGPIAGAIYFPNSARCLEPRLLASRFAERITAGGGEVVRVHAKALKAEANGHWSIFTESRPIVCQRVIVAAGRWSDALLKPLGYQVPLESERGYHLMLPKPKVALTRPLVVAERHFVITPMIHGIRLAGTVEFAGMHAPMNPRRSDMLFKQAEPLLNGLSRVGATHWMGHRPTLPDSVPAIGRAHAHPNLYYNFGHQHCGLTLAAVSAQLTADVIAERPLTIDALPYDLRRYSQRLNASTTTCS